LYLEVKQFELVGYQRVGVRQLFLGELFLEKVQVHACQISVTVPFKVEVIGQLGIGDILPGNVDLVPEVYEVSEDFSDTENYIIFFFIERNLCRLYCSLRSFYP